MKSQTTQRIEHLSGNANLVYNRLLQNIRDGKWRSGERIPSERVLESQCNHSRSAVREALEELERQGQVIRLSPRIRVVSDNVVPRRFLFERTIALFTGMKLGWGTFESGGFNVHESIVAGFNRCCVEKGLNVIQLPHISPDGDMLEQLVSEHLFGAVMFGDFTEEPAHAGVIDFLMSHSVPAVMYTDFLRPSRLENLPPCHRVGLDHFKGGKDLAEFLLKKNCRIITRCWGTNYRDEEKRPEWLIRRDAGIENALVSAGIDPIPPVWLPVQPGQAQSHDEYESRVYELAGRLATQLLPAGRMDALICMNDCMYHDIAGACEKLGLRPGKDILLVGYDDLWRSCAQPFTPPGYPAATVNRRIDRISELILGLFKDDPGKPVTRFSAPELIIN